MKEKENKNILEPINGGDSSPLLPIESLIHVIRGQQVMLDSDLARLYGVETRVLNQAVKRNNERFPEDFMFQLTEEDSQNLKSQNVMSSWGGNRKAPYAFTENGVAMLSSVLRSKTAIEVNIRIMRAFTSMRSFLISNAHMFKRLETIEHTYLLVNRHLSEHDRKFEEVLTRLDDKDSEPIEGFFFEGQIFDAYTLISDLIRKAKNRIILIDNYVDDRILKILTKRKEDVLATIYTDPRHSQISNDWKNRGGVTPEAEGRLTTETGF